MTAPSSSASDLDLLKSYEPIVRFNEGELFFPASIDEYVRCCELLEHTFDDDARVVVDRGDLTTDRLAEHGAAAAGGQQFMRFVDEPFSRVQVARWRRRPDRPRFRRADRLARVGLLSRIVDALMRLSLMFRGSVASGAQAAAETQYREHLRQDLHPYYGRVVRSGGYVAIQYWFFYVFNDWRSRVYGVNDHEADWEQVVVYLAEQPDGSHVPKWVVFSAHDEVGDDLRRRWDDPDLTLVGDHPVVFAGAGSHSGAYLAGEYLTTIDPPAFRGLVRWFRSIASWLLPWTNTDAQAGVGIPYVDYARGDGVAIGPGQDREWSPMLIGEQTPWLLDYRGLWGNDTEDRLGGERGPAGPRYERSGDVRQSWGDVVGWSGLAKVAPNATVALDLVQQRLDAVEVERKQATIELEKERTKLRADVATGIPTGAQQDEHLNRLAARRTELHDESRRLRRRLIDPPLEREPHDHLSHRRLPMPAQSRVRRRFLSVWAALSTPLVIGVTVPLLLPGQSAPVATTIFVSLIVLLVVEALARRNLFRFLSTIVVLMLIVVIVSAAAGLAFFYGWQVAVAVCLGVLSAILLAINLQELARD